ncbi:hypothetical protein ABAC460_02520 [Asticcacaulis sp. AC460]|uniref:hypothetical protein n=1 Tax=Asticcacaulis sp. AC460 TaxID=1282360 RepID=UPI0003C410D8|nr:hypothetical protein [Asticcacaulis sp. AC460]ESQ92723.1 hypothetical protein ABAC460_02520 [Asticcacaulis sp. AC460]
MTTPIRPSLAQMLNPQQAAPARPAAQATPQAGGFASAMQAQKAFFQQVTQPKITPATYTAADIARATPQVNTAPAPAAQDATQPLKRPGSYVNIVI